MCPLTVDFNDTARDSATRRDGYVLSMAGLLQQTDLFAIHGALVPPTHRSGDHLKLGTLGCGDLYCLVAFDGQNTTFARYHARLGDGRSTEHDHTLHRV